MVAKLISIKTVAGSLGRCPPFTQPMQPHPHLYGVIGGQTLPDCLMVPNLWGVLHKAMGGMGTLLTSSHLT